MLQLSWLFPCFSYTLFYLVYTIQQTHYLKLNTLGFQMKNKWNKSPSQKKTPSPAFKFEHVYVVFPSIGDAHYMNASRKSENHSI